MTIGVIGIRGSDKSLGSVGRDLDLRRREGIEVSDERSVVILVGEGTGVCFGERVTIVVIGVGVRVELVLILSTLALAALVVLCVKLMVFS